MKGKELEAYQKFWSECNRDAIQRAQQRGGEIAEYYIKAYQEVLPVMLALLPHFSRWELDYFGDTVSVRYRDNSELGYTTAVSWIGNDINIPPVLDQPKARATINKALRVLGHPARIAWRNGQPTITKGYTLKQSAFTKYYDIVKDDTPLQDQS